MNITYQKKFNVLSQQFKKLETIDKLSKEI